MFKAEDAVEKLDYDFRPYVDAVGTTPEPSSDEIVAFQIAQARFVSLADRLDLPNAETEGKLSVGDAIDYLESAIDDMAESDALLGTYFEQLEKVTHGQPSAAEVIALPGRVRNAYVGWLIGHLLDPKASTPGMRPSLEIVRGA